MILILLVGWSLLAAAWWMIAWGLLASTAAKSRPTGIPAPKLALSVFKSIPPGIGGAKRARLAAAIESFVEELDPESEMLLGVPLDQAGLWEADFRRWRNTYPRARIHVIYRVPPGHRANPKIGWMEILAAQAASDYWLWSDADIVAPTGLLDAVRHGLSETRGALTCAYRVSDAPDAVDALDALFVNVEFLPGVLLLGGRGISPSAFGAAIAFPAGLFKERLSWEELGSYLADDYLLGLRMGPVRLCPVIVDTLPLQGGFVAALRHYYRWHKTLKWCRPLSYGSVLSILPLLGWLAAVAVCPLSVAHWTGLAVQWMFEVLMAGALLRKAGCGHPTRAWWMLGIWPMIRCCAWVAAWLPLAVVWEGANGRWPGVRAARPAGLTQGFEAVQRRGGCATNGRTRNPP